MPIEYFLLAGAQRSGTTFLYDLLDQHPEIEMARPLRPEPKFFLSRDAASTSLEEYKKLFSGKPGARVFGEKSTSYIEHPGIARTAVSLLSPRVVFLLRDPVERAISNYRFSVESGIETVSLEDAILNEEVRREHYDHTRFSVSPFAYVARGRYYDFIQQWEEIIGRDRIHLVVSNNWTGIRACSKSSIDGWAWINIPPAVPSPAEMRRRSPWRSIRNSSASCRVFSGNRIDACTALWRRPIALAISFLNGSATMSGAPPEDRMFFLVGRGRSGTTLLKSILDAHPSISVAPEGLFVMNLYRSYRRGAWTPMRMRRFAGHLFLERRMRRWSLDRDELEERWLQTDDPTFARLCANVYEMHTDRTEKASKRLLGDKNPHYALFVRELGAIFPRARFVHVVRDYRDNVASYLNVPFDVKSPAALAHRWIHYNSAILDAAAREPARFHRLRFEDLVSTPGPTLQSLCDFLGIAMDPAMMGSRDTGSVDGLEWHRHVGKPITAELAGQWSRHLTRDQAATLDRICQPFAMQFGYAPAELGGAKGRRGPAGAAIGWSVTALERQVFKLPISVQALLINTYRRLTGNVIR
jgi:hypothetical protein